MMLQKSNTKKTESLVKVKVETVKQLEEQVTTVKNDDATLLLEKEKEKTETLSKVMTEKDEIVKQLEDQLTKEKEKVETFAKIEEETVKILEEQVATEKKESVDQGKVSCMMSSFDDTKKEIMGSELTGSHNAETEDSYIVRAKKLGLF